MSLLGPPDRIDAAEPIALLLPNLGPTGAVRSALTLAEGLRELGRAVEIWVAEGTRSSWPTPEGVPVISLQCGWRPPHLERLVERLRKVSPAALLCVTHPANMAGLLARRRTAVKLELQVKTTLSSFLSPGQLERVVAVMAHQYPAADAIVTVSERAAEDFCRLTGIPRSRVDVLKNATVGPSFAARAAAPARHPFFDDATPVVLGVGRLVPGKDFATLVHAFALARQQRPLRLLVLGEGLEREALTRLVDELGLTGDVALPGLIPDPLPYLRAASVFALSSRSEAAPNVIVEALACGTPVVATDCPSGPRELLEGGRLGRLVPVGDHQSLACALLETLDRPIPPETLKAATTDFSAEACARRHLEVLGLV